MIVREFYMTRPDNVDLYRTYSDANMMIRQEQTEALYTDAIDIDGSPYTYVETDIPIDASEEAEETEPSGPYLPPQQALDIVFGEVEE